MTTKSPWQADPRVRQAESRRDKRVQEAQVNYNLVVIYAAHLRDAVVEAAWADYERECIALKTEDQANA